MKVASVRHPISRKKSELRNSMKNLFQSVPRYHARSVACHAKDPVENPEA
jgi:hypothetical protein